MMETLINGIGIGTFLCIIQILQKKLNEKFDLKLLSILIFLFPLGLMIGPWGIAVYVPFFIYPLYQNLQKAKSITPKETVPKVKLPEEFPSYDREFLSKLLDSILKGEKG